MANKRIYLCLAHMSDEGLVCGNTIKRLGTNICSEPFEYCGV